MFVALKLWWKTSDSEGQITEVTLKKNSGRRKQKIEETPAWTRRKIGYGIGETKTSKSKGWKDEATSKRKQVSWFL